MITDQTGRHSVISELAGKKTSPFRTLISAIQPPGRQYCFTRSRVLRRTDWYSWSDR